MWKLRSSVNLILATVWRSPGPLPLSLVPAQWCYEYGHHNCVRVLRMWRDCLRCHHRQWGRQGSASFRPQPPPALITDKSVSKGKTRKVKGDTQHRGEDVKVVLQNVSIVRSHPSPLEEAETGAARVTRVSSYIYRGALGPGSWHLFIRQQFQCFMFHYQPNCIGMIFPKLLSPKSVFQTFLNIWRVCHDWRFTRRSFA